MMSIPFSCCMRMKVLFTDGHSIADTENPAEKGDSRRGDSQRGDSHGEGL